VLELDPQLPFNVTPKFLARDSARHGTQNAEARSSMEKRNLFDLGGGRASDAPEGDESEAPESCGKLMSPTAAWGFIEAAALERVDREGVNATVWSMRTVEDSLRKDCSALIKAAEEEGSLLVTSVRLRDAEPDSVLLGKLEPVATGTVSSP
jgi:hypothetical protein